MIKCTTGPKHVNTETSLEFNIAGRGDISTEGFLFYFVSYWSSRITWGQEFLPVDDEMVYVPPGLTLVMDIDHSPKLKAILVEGFFLIKPEADPQHERTLTSQYIFIRNGEMVIGTEEEPYTSKLTITLTGNHMDPNIPIYGNKVIGVRNGLLDIHGVKREPYWTRLEESVIVSKECEAPEGAVCAMEPKNMITLSEKVDWFVGDWIGIAPTSYGSRDSEKR